MSATWLRRARLVLAGFALAVAAATLSPWLRPSVLMWVRGVNGQVRLVRDTGAASRHRSTPMRWIARCACLPAGAPPPAWVALPGRPPRSLPRAWADGRGGPRPQALAPLPLRGPPVV